MEGEHTWRKQVLREPHPLFEVLAGIVFRGAEGRVAGKFQVRTCSVVNNISHASIGSPFVIEECRVKLLLAMPGDECPKGAVGMRNVKILRPFE